MEVKLGEVQVRYPNDLESYALRRDRYICDVLAKAKTHRR